MAGSPKLAPGLLRRTRGSRNAFGIGKSLCSTLTGLSNHFETTRVARPDATLPTSFLAARLLMSGSIASRSSIPTLDEKPSRCCHETHGSIVNYRNGGPQVAHSGMTLRLQDCWRIADDFVVRRPTPETIRQLQAYFDWETAPSPLSDWHKRGLQPVPIPGPGPTAPSRIVFYDEDWNPQIECEVASDQGFSRRGPLELPMPGLRVVCEDSHIQQACSFRSSNRNSATDARPRTRARRAARTNTALLGRESRH